MDADKPLTHDGQLREEYSRRPHPDYPADNSRPPNPDHEKSPRAIEQEVLHRRLGEEKAHYERGFPVAGHDFKREYLEREEHCRERGY